MAEPWVGQARPCGRGPEECDGTAEPEEDGEVRYWKCVKPECGFEFGYEVTVAQADSCQLGISVEGLRELEEEQFQVAVPRLQAPERYSLAHLATDPEFQRRLAASLKDVKLPGETGTEVFLGFPIRRRAE